MSKNKTAKKAAKGAPLVAVVREEAGQPVELAGEDYFSAEVPTIDTPPQPDPVIDSDFDEVKEQRPDMIEPLKFSSDDAGQTEIPGAETVKPKQSRRVKYQLKLAADGYVIPIAAGEVPADMVEESLLLGMNARRFRDVLREIVGGPLNFTKCNAQTAAERETLLNGVIATAEAALSKVKHAIQSSPERYSHDEAITKLKDILAAVTVGAEAMRKQFSGETV